MAKAAFGAHPFEDYYYAKGDELPADIRQLADKIKALDPEALGEVDVDPLVLGDPARHDELKVQLRRKLSELEGEQK